MTYTCVYLCVMHLHPTAKKEKTAIDVFVCGCVIHTDVIPGGGVPSYTRHAHRHGVASLILNRRLGHAAAAAAAAAATTAATTTC